MLIMDKPDKPVTREYNVILAVKWRHKYLHKNAQIRCKFTV